LGHNSVLGGVDNHPKYGLALSEGEKVSLLSSPTGTLERQYTGMEQLSISPSCPGSPDFPERLPPAQTVFATPGSVDEVAACREGNYNQNS